MDLKENKKKRSKAKPVQIKISTYKYLHSVNVFYTGFKLIIINVYCANNVMTYRMSILKRK